MDFKLNKGNLNFRVYTVPSKPTAAGADNDIAIISSVPMKNWMMSPDKPSGIPRTDGDVWIRYSVTGETFNALKNNSMMIATISAWQYVNDAWVDVTALSYQNGAWVMYLFINGDQCERITGGWVCGKSGFTLGSINAAGNLYMGGSQKMFGTPGPISKGLYTKVCFEVVSVKQHSNDPSALISIPYTPFDTSNAAIAYSRPTAPGTVKLELPDTVTEFCIVMYSYYSDEVLEISRIWME